MMLNTADIPNLYENEERLDIIEKVSFAVCSATFNYLEIPIARDNITSSISLCCLFSRYSHFCCWVIVSGTVLSSHPSWKTGLG